VTVASWKAASHTVLVEVGTGTAILEGNLDCLMLIPIGIVSLSSINGNSRGELETWTKSYGCQMLQWFQELTHLFRQ
jgi:hypothetical protein